MRHWPIIRHVRFFYLSWRVNQWARQWARCGIGFGQPNEADIKHLALIWQGRA